MSVLRRRSIKREIMIEERITTVLAEVGPLLRIDHCEIGIVEYSRTTGRLVITLDGSCPDCELSPATFMPAIEAHVRQRVPEVRQVSMVRE